METLRKKDLNLREGLLKPCKNNVMENWAYLI